jgi:hypothetical protein
MRHVTTAISVGRERIVASSRKVHYEPTHRPLSVGRHPDPLYVFSTAQEALIADMEFVAVLVPTTRAHAKAAEAVAALVRDTSLIYLPPLFSVHKRIPILRYDRTARIIYFCRWRPDSWKIARGCLLLTCFRSLDFDKCGLTFLLLVASIVAVIFFAFRYLFVSTVYDKAMVASWKVHQLPAQHQPNSFIYLLASHELHMPVNIGGRPFLHTWG